AVGWMEDEFKALGVPFEKRGALSDEYLAAFKALWTQDRPSFQGRYVQFEKIVFDPKPVQKPHPPIWIGGNSRQAMRRAVIHGDAWHPTRALVADIRTGAACLKELCEERGRDPQTLSIAARLPLKFFDDPEAAGERRPLLGSPQQIVDEIGQYREAGVRYIMLDTFYSAPELEHETLETMLATMERFASEVMPHFRP
ncbi:MAG TPA: LLM class flavin-dependent oxidoreductase, partial [Blastocatellia bacterium]|nr:LLM class flavin-dependent oxidoreductase [Blastocatellia bacterium]